MSDFKAFVKQSNFAQWPKKIQQAEDALRLFHGRGQCFVDFEYFSVDYFEPVLWIVVERQPQEDFCEEVCAER